MTPDVECVVIGAGAVGLAIAADLAAAGYEVLIIEREDKIGSQTSSRNSEVIHAGIYYPSGSLKARYCVEGKAKLYTYCRERHIPFRQCGKLIVAADFDQQSKLQAIARQAYANGVQDLKNLARQDVATLEPQLECMAALWSPSTGIVDSHALMLSLLGDAENHGASLALRARVEKITPRVGQTGCQLSIQADEHMSLTSRYVINAAGHGAPELFNAAAEDVQTQRVTPVLLKGNYYRLTGKVPFNRLIYPVPEEGGLGVHLTLDLSGQARFGPDVEPVEYEDYQVNREREDEFYTAIRRYWPGLPPGSLSPDYAGIRPKVKWQGALYGDFLIQPDGHPAKTGLVHLLGIESPGLTACLSIASAVREWVDAS